MTGSWPVTGEAPHPEAIFCRASRLPSNNLRPQAGRLRYISKLQMREVFGWDSAIRLKLQKFDLSAERLVLEHASDFIEKQVPFFRKS